MYQKVSHTLTTNVDKSIYKEYMNSDRWEKKKEEYYKKFDKRCRMCRTKKYPLQIHHLSYSKLGNEPMRDLMALCKVCHEEVHRYFNMKNGDITLRQATLDTLDWVRKKQKKKSNYNHRRKLDSQAQFSSLRRK